MACGQNMPDLLEKSLGIEAEEEKTDKNVNH